MQGAAQFAGALFRFELARLRQGLLAQDGDEGVELGVVDRDTRETGFGELCGGDGARPNPGCRFRETQGCQVFGSLAARNARSGKRKGKSTASDRMHRVLL